MIKVLAVQHTEARSGAGESLKPGMVGPSSSRLSRANSNVKLSWRPQPSRPAVCLPRQMDLETTSTRGLFSNDLWCCSPSNNKYALAGGEGGPGLNSDCCSVSLAQSVSRWSVSQSAVSQSVSQSAQLGWGRAYHPTEGRSPEQRIVIGTKNI